LGQIDAFEGLKQAMDTTQLLLVRGRSAKNKTEDLGPTISQIFKDLMPDNWI
jgi:hypothetical protein